MNTTKILLILSIVLFFVLVILLVTGVIPGLNFTTGKKVTLTVWGVFDDSDIFVPVIQRFQERYPNVTIVYKKKNFQTYQDDLIRAFAAGKGPDIFMVNNKWVPKLKYLMDVAPANIISADEYRKRFVDVAIKDFTYGKLIYGLPLYVDTLAMYYNVNLFNNAGIINPPKDWREFEKDVKLLTKRQGRNIIVSGAALGGGSNISNSADILSLLFLQRGVDIVDKEGKAIFSPRNIAMDVLDFYSKFADPQSEFYSWSKDFPENSIDRFASGRAAIIFGYSYIKNIIKQKSPRLRFEVAYMPQVKDTLYKKNYADYFGFSVYTNSKNKFYAWKFLKFLTDPENVYVYVMTKRLASADKTLLAVQQKEDDLKIFANQALTADSWFMVDDEFEKKVFVDMLDAYLPSDKNAQVVLKKAIDKINNKISK